MTCTITDNDRPAEMCAIEQLAVNNGDETTTIRDGLKSGDQQFYGGHVLGTARRTARDAGLINKNLEEPEQRATVHPTWFTRDETVRLLQKNIKTVDRYRKKGLLQDLDTHGSVRISRESIERLLRRPIEPLPNQNGRMVVETQQYQKIILELQHYKTAAEKLEQLEVANAAKEAKFKQLQENCTVVDNQQYQKLVHDHQHHKATVEKLELVDAERAAKVAECKRLQEELGRVQGELRQVKEELRQVQEKLRQEQATQVNAKGPIRLLGWKLYYEKPGQKSRGGQC